MKLILVRFMFLGILKVSCRTAQKCANEARDEPKTKKAVTKGPNEAREKLKTEEEVIKDPVWCP